MSGATEPDGRDCDVIVAGAGLAGLTAAIAFARAGFRRPGLRGGRANGARPHSRDARPLGRLSRITRALVGDRAQRAGDARRSALIDDTGALFPPRPVEFHCSEIGLETFGWNVENDRMADALAACAERTPGLERVEDPCRELRLRRANGAGAARGRAVSGRRPRHRSRRPRVSRAKSRRAFPCMRTAIRKAP